MEGEVVVDGAADGAAEVVVEVEVVREAVMAVLMEVLVRRAEGRLRSAWTKMCGSMNGSLGKS